MQRGPSILGAGKRQPEMHALPCRQARPQRAQRTSAVSATAAMAVSAASCKIGGALAERR